MSYSFNVRARTTEEAETKIRAELAKVAQSQPIHEHDAEAAADVAVNYLSLLALEPSMDVTASVAGYLSWSGADNITTASINVSVSLAARED